MEKIRILTVDDHEVVRKGIRMIVGTDPTLQIVGEAEDGQGAVDLFESLQPDIILMDLVMTGRDGVDAIIEIKQSQTDVKIIVLTTYKDHNMFKAALAAGADGYLLKDADGKALIRAVHAVLQGEMPLHPSVTCRLFRETADDRDTHMINGLTDRELEILGLIARGLSNKAIAQALFLTEGTVGVHVSNILSKLNVSNRTEATLMAVKMESSASSISI